MIGQSFAVVMEGDHRRKKSYLFPRRSAAGRLTRDFDRLWPVNTMLTERSQFSRLIGLHENLSLCWSPLK